METKTSPSKKIFKADIPLPEGFTAQYEDGHLILKEKVQLSRLYNDKGVDVSINNNVVQIVGKMSNKRVKTTVNTYKAHIKNMIKGIQSPYVYKLKICSGHFPMTVVIEKNALVVKNFLGEKVPRVYKWKDGVTVKVDGEIITVESADKELAGMASGALEQLTRRPGFDPRIFQDGIYLIEREGRSLK